MHVMYKHKDVHVMPTNLPRQLGTWLENSTELEQTSSRTELLKASYIHVAKDSHFIPRSGLY